MPYIFAGKSGYQNSGLPDKTAPGQTRAFQKGKTGMGRLIKLAGLVVVLGFAGLVGYAYLADMTPVRQQVKQPVVLNAQ